MSDEQLVSYTEQLMDEEGLEFKKDIIEKHGGLYESLRQRELLEKVNFKPQRRKWQLMSDDEVLSHTKDFMRERGITKKSELSDADGGIYFILRDRDLLNRIPFEQVQRESRDWSSMNDAEVLSYAGKFIMDRQITELSEITSDPGLYQVLRKRDLLTQLSLKSKLRWASMDDKSLTEHARKAILAKGITTRTELQEKTSQPL